MAAASMDVNIDIHRFEVMEHVGVAVVGGGQSGLAAAQAHVQAGLKPLVLEASERVAGRGRGRRRQALRQPAPVLGARFRALPGLPCGGTRTATRTATRSSLPGPARLPPGRHPARPRHAHAAGVARPGGRSLRRSARRGPARAPHRLHRPGRREGHRGGRVTSRHGWAALAPRRRLAHPPRGSRSQGWSGSEACPRTPCAGLAGWDAERAARRPARHLSRR
ncbi:NAD(P)-binding protein [Streptomyces sp. NPDC012888]|uniref:NAD(P)-binding protein n=1 Tax=Streptomyces sp. NPDC012888 TaxID=3364855 RepID=UPI00369E1819